MCGGCTQALVARVQRVLSMVFESMDPMITRMAEAERGGAGKVPAADSVHALHSEGTDQRPSAEVSAVA